MKPYAPIATISCSRDSWKHGPIADAATRLAEDDREQQPDTPIVVASAIRPLRNRYM